MKTLDLSGLAYSLMSHLKRVRLIALKNNFHLEIRLQVAPVFPVESSISTGSFNGLSSLPQPVDKSKK